jgi:8-hydroxy-5-deazaflavin:NADPH oxidoreductase
MRIGIIGAGNIGGTLVRRLSALGHEVAVANSRGPETLRDLAEETHAKASTIQQVAHESEMVVVTIPEGRIRDLPKDLFVGAPKGLVVVDTGNYHPNGKYGREADGFIEEIEEGMPESRWVEAQLNHPVIKVFNSILADDLMHRGRVKGDPTRVALPVAGDDQTAKAAVIAIVDELGFDAVDVGSLDESWRQQPGTPVYVQNLNIEELKRGLSKASAERSPEWRAGRFTRTPQVNQSDE